jgi:hypothetical protein
MWIGNWDHTLATYDVTHTRHHRKTYRPVRNLTFPITSVDMNLAQHLHLHMQVLHSFPRAELRNRIFKEQGCIQRRTPSKQVINLNCPYWVKDYVVGHQ